MALSWCVHNGPPDLLKVLTVEFSLTFLSFVIQHKIFAENVFHFTVEAQLLNKSCCAIIILKTSIIFPCIASSLPLSCIPSFVSVLLWEKCDRHTTVISLHESN